MDLYFPVANHNYTLGRSFNCVVAASVPEPMLIYGMQLLIQYDPRILALTGWMNTPEAGWSDGLSGFLSDAPGINQNIADGEAILMLCARPGVAVAVGDFLPVCKLNFNAIGNGRTIITLGGSHTTASGGVIRTRISDTHGRPVPYTVRNAIRGVLYLETPDAISAPPSPRMVVVEQQGQTLKNG